ncbi:MAG TPA: hypothetical protein VJO14_05800 [Bacteroidota bacterium]|nr:hypothetical protein [Bacteroidota bacterium]
MRTHLFILLFTPALLAAQPSLADFFPTADSVTEHAPFKNELTAFCQVKLLERWVSFVGFKKSRVVLYVTFTRDSIADPVADVSPIVGYDHAKPTLGKVQTWGYPFDRNRDGKIDYLALVGGAAPFEDGDFPVNYPLRNEEMMMHHVQLFVEKCRIIFNHWADENYDGNIDAVIQADMDTARDWVYRYIYAASTARDGKLDEVWSFRTDTSSFNDTVSVTAEGVRYNPIGTSPAVLGAKDLDEKSAVMTLMNEAADSCGHGAFRLSTGTAPDPGQE